ncbi:unnamed protein product, partial [Rotaria sordida]
FDKQCACS